MRVIGSFNNISDVLKDRLKQLEPGQIARIKIIEVCRQQDPETKEVHISYPHRQVWAKDTIWDEGANDGLGGSVEIGVPSAGGFDLKNGTVSKVEYFEFNDYKNGICLLDGSKPIHRELYEFIQLTNMSGDSLLGDHRDSSIEKLFNLVDAKKESRRKNELFNKKADAFTFVRNMKAEDIREFAAAMNWDNWQGDLDSLESQIKDFADKDPLAFTRFAEDSTLKRKAIIKKAMGSVITYDPAGHQIKWMNGTVLASLERKPNQNEVDAFADWLSAAANGDQILAKLRGAKAKQASAEA